MTTADHAPYDKPVWGSDVMVDALRQLDLPYVSLNRRRVAIAVDAATRSIRRRRDEMGRPIAVACPWLCEGLRTTDGGHPA